MRTSRLTRTRIKKHVKRVRMYSAIAIVVAVIIYIFVRGAIDFTKDLFNVVAEAPTIGRVFANEREPRLTMTAEEVNKWELFKQKAYELAPIYDFPVKVILAQAALESHRGQSKFAKERNNFFGFQCYDEDPDKYCAYYDNPEQSILSYMSLIKNQYPEAYNSRKNPEKMIQLIKDGGYATDENYVAKVTGMPEWEAHE